LTTIGGIASLLLGAAYVWLGAVAFVELRRGRRERGLSPFGVAFMLMALTCGPHHLAHAEHGLLRGGPGDPLTTVALLLGLPAGAVFVWLRVETMRGGRGDRVIAGTPAWLALLPIGGLLVAGAIATLAIQRAATHGSIAWEGIPGLALSLAFACIGYYLVRAQMARGGTIGWSLSGLALAGIFTTCALMHLTSALAKPDAHMFAIDLVGVPCALAFLWIVNRLYRAALHDWNSRPLRGRAQPTSRRSPWVLEPGEEPLPASG
jgi:hypothetical protein